MTELTLERPPLRTNGTPESVRALAIAVVGQLDIATAQMFERELASGWAKHVAEIAVALGGVKFMDSAGLHALERVCQHRQSQGQHIHLVRVPRQAGQLLQLAANAYNSVAALHEVTPRQSWLPA